MSQVLVEGGVYTLKAKQITAAAASFKDGDKQFFSHSFLLVDDEGNEYPSQICDLSTQQGYCNPGDIIEIKVKGFTKGVYNLKFGKLVQRGKAAPTQTVASNPMVSGSAAAEAMRLSVEHFKYKEEGNGVTLFTMADDIFIWLKNKANS